MISVIMPAYNAEGYIREAIDSVLGQSFTDFELIIINDGSKDDTQAIAEEYVRIDNRVRVIRQENKGEAGARNRGIAAASGEYITFLDSDDLWMADFLLKMYEAIHMGKNREFVYCKSDTVFPDGTIQKADLHMIPEGKLSAYVTSWHELRFTFDMNSFLLRRSLLEKYAIGFDEGMIISPDIGFFMKILCVTKAYALSESLSFYRRHDGSATMQKWTPERWESTVEIYEPVEKYVRAYYSDFLPEFQAMRNYRAYRFIWGTVKEGYIEKALEYIQRWAEYLRNFAQGDGKWNDRLKCRVFLCRKAWLLKILRCL